MKIQDIHAREIFDSRGIPTVECDLFLSDGNMFTASVPSGTSKSIYEAVELRDGGERLNGLGVQGAVSTIENIIAPIFIDRAPDLVMFDMEMIELDQTVNKSYLGANAMLAVSMAICRAQSYIEGLDLYEFIAHVSDCSTVELPSPMFNFLGGGMHADNNFPIQEILLVPAKKTSFHDAMEIGVEIFYSLKNVLKQKGKYSAIGIEGGFVSLFNNPSEAFDILMEAVYQSKHTDVKISLDVAASHFYNNETGLYNWFGNNIAAPELIDWYGNLIKQYPIYSIEDGLDQSDWNEWITMTALLGDQVKIVGDDIFATNADRIWKGIEQDVANTVLIKPNQVGTVTEALQAIALCKENDMNVIISHRSGETNDSFIADLAVGVSASHIKAGGCSRGERIAKYNRLLNIEQDLMVL